MNTMLSPQLSRFEPTDEEIRDYAYHLYEQSGCIPGRDLENWIEARDILRANIPRTQPETQLAKQDAGLVSHR